MSEEAVPSTDARRPPQTERGLDRLVNFTDAVVAIAITLIVLPLVDLASDETAAHLLLHHRYSVVAAIVSFAVIGLFWREHHAEMERATRYTNALVTLNLVWIATVAFLPVPTALLFSSANTPDLLAVGIYIGTMLATMVTMRLIQLVIIRSCTDQDAGEPTRFRLGLDWIPVGLMAVAFVVAVLGAGAWALFVMFLSYPVIGTLVVLHRRRQRRLGLPAG